MATYSIHTRERDTGGAQRTTHAPLHVVGQTIKYRLAVVATTTVDAVEFAGGLMCDRAIAGWDVTVIIADRSDRMPLQILGATVVDLEDALASGASGSGPHSVAVGADLLGGDSRVSRRVSRTLNNRDSEVIIWGQTRDARVVSRRFGLVEHRLSLAARAFKAHAMTAAACPATVVTASEKFYTSAVARTSATADLMQPN